jgi:hypothetical protein
LRAGAPVTEQATWSAHGQSLLPGLRPGDLVALHWDWVCDILTEDQAARIEDHERRQLDRLRLA